MKINTITTGQLEITATGKNSAASTGLSFQDILAQQLTATGETVPTGAVSGVQAVAPIAAGLKVDSLSMIEESIKTMEKFGASLGNPAFSLQDLKPFADALAEESSALMALKNQLPADNPLAALLERVATVSYVEAAKLQRGDYHA